MKKITAILSALAMLTSLTVFPASAETAVPVDVDEAVYALLLDSYGCDDNEDGVVTEEEFRSVLSLRMNPCGFEDLSWMAGMESLTSLILEEGTLSDAAAQSLLQVPQIDSIQMYNVTLSSIGFLGEMQLDYCRMQECTPFSDSELLSIMRVEDVTVQKGFAAKGGVFPEGLFSTNDLMLTIGDTDVACLDTYGTVQSPSSNSIFYGKEVGETTFTLSIYGNEEFTGTITVEDFTPEAIPLHETAEELPEVLSAIHHGGGIGTALLKGNTLYSLNDGALQVEAENVESFHYAYIYNETGRNNHCDIVLYQDGSVTVDGKPLQSDLEFDYAENGVCVAGDGGAYAIREENGEFYADYLYSGFGTSDSKVGQYFFSTDGEVMTRAYMLQEDGSYRWEVFPMGITDVVSSQGRYFVDKNQILWEITTEKGEAPAAVQIAENVQAVGYYRYEEYSYPAIIYITTDGKAKLPSTHKEVTLCENQLEEEVVHYLDAANFSVWYTEDGKMMSDPSVGHDYHLSLDSVLTIDCRGVKTGITDVAQFVDNDYAGYGETVYAYFLRTDGSLWCYSSDTGSYSEIPFTTPEPLAGDANADGTVNVADAVLLQKYLLGKTDLTTAQAENAELCADSRLDGFDLAWLKRMLLTR